MKLSIKFVIFLSSLCIFLVNACCRRGQHRDVSGTGTVTMGRNGRPTGGTVTVTVSPCHAGATGACASNSDAQVVPSGEVIQMPANYKPSTSAASLLRGLARAIDKGAEIAGGACGPACGPDPGSPACLQCRQDVAVGSMTPFVSYCLGSAFETPPDSFCAVLRATTDGRTFESQPIRAFKRLGTVRYDDCGGPHLVDYDFDQGPTQAFASYVESQQPREIPSTVWFQVPCPGGATGEGYEAIVRLNSDAKELILSGRVNELDGPATQFSHSVWPFQGGGGDLYIGEGEPDGAVLISTGLSADQLIDLANDDEVTLSGRASVQLKPCYTDVDCQLWPPLRCLSTPQWGLVCKDPAAP